MSWKDKLIEKYQNGILQKELNFENEKNTNKYYKLKTKLVEALIKLEVPVNTEDVLVNCHALKSMACHRFLILFKFRNITFV